MRKYLVCIAATAILLTGCGSPGGEPEMPSATQTQSASSPSIQPPTPEPTPPFSPAIPPPPPEVVCEVTEARAETEYGELASGDNADLSAELTGWSPEVLNELKVTLTAHDQDTPSVRVVVHVLVESDYAVLQAQLIWSDGEQEELSVDYLSAPIDRIEGQAQDIDIIFVGEDRSMQLVIVC